MLSARTLIDILIPTTLFLALSLCDTVSAGPEVPAGYPVCLTEFADPDAPDKDPQACGIVGNCDLPEFRDAAYPDQQQPFTIIRTLVHILAEDDGSNPATNFATLQGQMATANAVFAQHRIQFQWTYKMDSVSQFRNVELLTGPDVNQMKTALAVAPASQLNIYVTNTNPSGGTGIPAYFGSALTATGGIVADDDWFSGGFHLIIHEMGHVFGLHHTHRGVSETNQCAACYESADGFEGDVRGDFCSDTPPTPVNYLCSQPGGVDPCSEVPWGTTAFWNFMGYAHPTCMTSFTAQQVGRMHCWINARLTGWFACPGVVPPPTAGEDTDNDTWTDSLDNCPSLYNPCQEDSDSSGYGDICECECDCGPDPLCDGIISDISDVILCIAVAFRSEPPLEDPAPFCTAYVSDVDCSGTTTVVDVIRVINVAFRGVSATTEYCDPCALVE